MWSVFALGISPEELRSLARESSAEIDLFEFPDTPDAVANDANRALARAKKKIKGVVALPLERVTFGNTAEALDSALGDLYDATQAMTHLSVAVDDERAAVARHQAQRLQKYLDETFLDQEIARRVGVLRGQVQRGGARHRLFEVLERYFHANSSHTKPILDSWEIKGLHEGISERVQLFSAATKSKEPLKLSRADLTGLSEKQLESLPRAGDAYLVAATSWADSDLVLRYAQSESVRRELWMRLFMGGDPQNEERAALITAARRRIAKRYGYESWLDYASDGAVFPSRGLISRLNHIAEETEARFRAEKARMRKILGRAPKAWDFRYCHQRELERLGLDQSLREYFPLPVVLSGLMAYAGQLLGLRFEKVEGAKVWDPRVEVWAVFDADKQKLLSTFALDLFERPGKEGGFYNLVRFSGRHLRSDHVRPSSFVHASFSPPVPGEQTLLTLEEVWTLFHEFGHALHVGLNRQTFAMLGVSGNIDDLVEFPSVFFERLAWEPTVIGKIARHCTTGESLPDEKIRAIGEARRIFAVHRLRDRLTETIMDVKLHSAKSYPLRALERQVSRRYYYPLPPEARYTASFEWLDGYEGTFISYLLGDASAQQLLERFRGAPEGFWDRTEGKRFRRMFLESGGRWKSPELIRRALGEPLEFCSSLILSVTDPEE